MKFHIKPSANLVYSFSFFCVFSLTSSVQADNAIAPMQIVIIKKPVGSTSAVPIIINPYKISHVNLNEDQQRAFDNLKTTLSNKSLPAKEAYSACIGFFALIGGHEPGLGQIDYQQIDDLLSQNQDKSISPLIKGYFNIDLAWEWRGNNYADKLKNIQVNMFAEKLAVAASALNEAWALNPKDVLIPNAMLNVELGQGKGKATMELWFQRAMNLDTNNYFACVTKLTYLEPKWYGSTGEMIAFGRECLESTNWGGKVPLILVAAHRVIAESYLDNSSRAIYWKQPAVWRDISAVYDKFLTSNPDDSRTRQYYAYLAYLGDQWNVLNKQLPLIGTPDYTIFGGKVVFDEMIKRAKEHAVAQ